MILKKINNIITTISVIIGCLLLLGCDFKKNETDHTHAALKNINYWMKAANNANEIRSKRIQFLQKSYDAMALLPEDTIKSKKMSSIAYQALKLKDTVLFKKSNKAAHKIAIDLKHNFSIADTHWNYAYYHLSKEMYDSVYYHYHRAYYHFNSMNHEYYTAKMLYNMAIIKRRFRDYTGSENLILQAIPIYKALKKNKSLYESYNYLAVLYKELKEYNTALSYHEKALEYLKKIDDTSNFFEGSLNNIGIVYRELGDYDQAIVYFDKALENDSLRVTNLKLFARLIDNRAYCKLLNQDTLHIKEEFFKALHIRDSIDHRAGIVSNKIHLAEYFLSVKNQDKAFGFAKEANELSKVINGNQDYLRSLKLLSKADHSGEKKYLEHYISFSDSLYQSERKKRNKLTRIALETDEYIQENKRLYQQKIVILIIAISLVTLFALLYFIKVQKSRNDQLIIKNKQQKANEQIYILSLEHKTKLEEGRMRERNRISEELHDGVLGKLFGTRFGLGFLDLEGSDATLGQFQSFLKELHAIEKEIRAISHNLKYDLKTSDLDFVVLIQDLFEEKSILGGFSYQLKIDEGTSWDEIGEIIKVNLYRILQEALLNIVKHAKAKQVTLYFSIKNKNINLVLEDDGIGYLVSKTKKGIGVKNMTSRVERLGGTLKVSSAPDHGTKVTVMLPF